MIPAAARGRTWLPHLALDVLVLPLQVLHVRHELLKRVLLHGNLRREINAVVIAVQQFIFLTQEKSRFWIRNCGQSRSPRGLCRPCRSRATPPSNWVPGWYPHSAPTRRNQKARSTKLRRTRERDQLANRNQKVRSNKLGRTRERDQIKSEEPESEIK